MNTVILISSMGLFAYPNGLVMDVSKNGRFHPFVYNYNLDGSIFEIGVGHNRWILIVVVVFFSVKIIY